MSMTTGGGGGYSSDINVTPMIDILLVLLIIFMVIVPVTPKGLDAMVPQPPKDPNKKQQDPSDRTIVVQVLHVPGGAPQYKINETSYAKQDLLPKLSEIYANRAERIMFVKGDDDINFAYVAEVIDMGRAANVDHIGLMTPKILAGQ
jgi:biopolymer transport protein TolR